MSKSYASFHYFYFANDCKAGSCVYISTYESHIKQETDNETVPPISEQGRFLVDSLL